MVRGTQSCLLMGLKLVVSSPLTLQEQIVFSLHHVCLEVKDTLYL